jgi:hypothetical protein
MQNKIIPDSVNFFTNSTCSYGGAFLAVVPAKHGRQNHAKQILVSGAK